MGRLKAFASTRVSVANTRDSIERLLESKGIKASRWTHFSEDRDTRPRQPGRLIFEFEWRATKERPMIGYRLAIEYAWEPGPRGGNAGSTAEQAARALFWFTKNIFDAVAFGIVSMEEAFLPYMLIPGEGGKPRTLYESLEPQIYSLDPSKMPPLLSDPEAAE